MPVLGARTVKCPACRVDCPAELRFCGTCGAALSTPSTNAKTQLRGSPKRDKRSDSAQALIGSVVGSYRLHQLLGEGGMGRVYLAEHTRLGRKVALKMLRAEYADQPHVVTRFFAEARAVNKICHENIVEITDFIEGSEGGGEDPSYFIMELLRGLDLAEAERREGVLNLDRSLGLAVQVCSALAAVHEAGIVHRDLKPENIFLTERAGQKDFVKLLDFGVAKLMEGQDGAVQVAVGSTAAGVVMGTPDYMPPEQACGKRVDYRADIYAFGVILYELVTGQKPFQGETFGDLVVQHSTVIPLEPSKYKDLPHKVAPELEALIMHCLAKEPQQRPGSMREIERRLRDIASGQQVALEAFIAAPAEKRRKLLWIGGAAAAGLIAAVGLVAFSRGASRELSRAPLPTPPPAGGQPPVVAPAPSQEPVPPPSPPHVEAPAAPAAATKVTLRFESSPAGAEVWAGAAKLGTTPFDRVFTRADRGEVFEFRLPGHVVVKREASLTKDDKVVAQLPLVKAAARVQPPPGQPKPGQAKPKPKPGKSDVINPFDGQ